MAAGQVLSHAWVQRRWVDGGGGGCEGREGWRRPSEVARRSRVATPPHGKLVLAPLQDTLMDGGE